VRCDLIRHHVRGWDLTLALCWHSATNDYGSWQLKSWSPDPNSQLPAPIDGLHPPRNAVENDGETSEYLSLDEFEVGGNAKTGQSDISTLMYKSFPHLCWFYITKFIFTLGFISGKQNNIFKHLQIIFCFNQITVWN